jgi:TatD DNase family protein
MIDTHAHLRLIPPAPPFDKGGKSDIFGIDDLKWVVLAASNKQDSLDNLRLAKENPKLKPAVGVHPQELITNYELLITNLEDLLVNNKNIVAIGECGLEFTEGANKNSQEILFRKQIELSLKYKKPLIVHSREAIEETLEILKSYKNLRGVIHCYSGGKKRIKKILELGKPPTASQSWRSGWYFGIDGNVTYEIGLSQVVLEIPKDRLILETDTPFLAPIPHRGETNRPEYVRFIYQKIAEIWKMGFAETEAIIDGNAERLFAK